MLQITQRNDKWRLAILREEWEFQSHIEMEEVIHLLLTLKKEHGQLFQEVKPHAFIGEVQKND
jgi:hypothetical protein